MKIVQAANGKRSLKITKAEWEGIGKQAGWMKTAGLQQMFDESRGQHFFPSNQQYQAAKDPAQLDKWLDQIINWKPSVNEIDQDVKKGMDGRTVATFLRSIWGQQIEQLIQSLGTNMGMNEKQIWDKAFQVMNKRVEALRNSFLEQQGNGNKSYSPEFITAFLGHFQR